MPGPWLLMYHSVTDYERDPYRITVRPRRFDAQLAWLYRRGLRGVGVGELLDARRRGHGRGLVGLTFDDGYRDTLEEVVPLLDRYGFGATVYVVAGLLGGDNRWDRDGERKPLMTADEVRTVARAGVEIGAHGMTHVRLTETDDVRGEVAGSRRVLEEVVDAPIRGFCYPYGAHDPAVVEAVRAAGYDHACAVGRPADAGRFALPRTYVGDQDNTMRLEAKRLRHRITDEGPLPRGGHRNDPRPRSTASRW